MLKVIRSRIKPYAVSILAVASALILTRLLQLLFDASNFPLFYAAVAFSSWYGGMEAGLLATILSTIVICYFFLAPVYTLAIAGLGIVLRLGVFILVTLLIGSLTSELRTAKRRLEKNLLKLRASEARSRRLIDTAYEGIWTIVADARIEYVNQRMAEMLGYSVEEMVGHCAYDFIDELDRQEAQRKFDQQEQHIREQSDFRLRRKDGSVIWVLTSTNAILDENGDWIGLLGMVTDVTERKLAEEALRNSEARYRSIVDSNMIGIGFWELEGTITDANFALIQMLGYTREEFLSGQIRWTNITPPEYSLVDKKALAEIAATGFSTPFEKEYIRKDGSRLPILIGASHFEGCQDKGTFFVLDISEAKRTEKALQMSEERYRELFENANDIVYTLDLAGKLTSLNKAGERITGYRREEILNQAIAQMVVPEYTQMMQQMFDRKVTGEKRTTYELEIFAKDQRRIVLEVSSSLIYQKGKPAGMQGIARDITGRKAAEKRNQQLANQVQEQANTLDAILWASVDNIYIVDRVGRYKNVSVGGAKVLGFKPSDLVGKTWQDLELSSDFLQEFDHQRKQVISTNKPIQAEIDFPTPDGVRHYEYIVAPLHNQDQGVEGVVVVSRDVSDRKDAEKALKESEKRFRTLVEQSPLSKQILSPNGKTLMVNRAWEELWGLTLDQISDYNILEDEQLVVKGVMPYIKRGFAGEAVVIPAIMYNPNETIPDRTMHKDPQRWVRGFIYPVKDEEGNIRQVVLIHEDITPRIRAEEALQETNQTLQALIQACPLAITVFNFDGEVKLWNPSAERIFGWSEQEALGHFIPSVPEDKRQEFLANLDTVKQGQPLVGMEARSQKKNGLPIDIALWAALLHDAQGNISCMSIIADITERKQLEAERAQLLASEKAARNAAEAANRTKDEFLATLSHELRTPLNAMLGWTQLLRTRKFDDKTAARALETIDRNTKSLAQLIEDVLDVSRIITGKLRLNVNPLKLAPVIEAAIDTVQPAAEAKEIQMECILDPLTGKVLGDFNRLQQVVWNLLSNAIKFTPQGGRVEIQLLVKGSTESLSYAQIRVTDTGKGIAPNFLPYVFERFQQADSSITRSYGGLGLGLAIVRHLVELHGGTVQAESLGEGQGATFTVQLPLLEKSRGAGEQESKGEKESNSAFSSSFLRGLRVLVVDDEADARELLIAVLEDYGAEVTAVASAGEALKALLGKVESPAQTQRSKFDVLVSDIGMPGVDGYALIRQVRALDSMQGGRIPAVALTAYARVEDRTEALLAGFQIHVPKPVNPAELAEIVANLTKRTGKSFEF